MLNTNIMEEMICTETGMKLYRYFLSMDCVMSTDSNFENYIHGLKLKFSNPIDIEEIIIKWADEIKMQRKII